MKNEALTIPHDEVQTIPVADLRDVPLAQLPTDADVQSMVGRMLEKAGGQPHSRVSMFGSAI